MADAPRKQMLKPVLEACCGSIREAVGAAVPCRVEFDPKGLAATTVSEVAALLTRPAVLVRGAFEDGPPGASIRFVCDGAAAAALAAPSSASGDESPSPGRGIALDAERLATFGTVARAICAGIDGVLREHLGARFGVRLDRHALLPDGGAAAADLGRGAVYELNLTLRVGDAPATRASLLVDRTLGDEWNGGPVEFAPPGASHAEDEDDGPAAPVRGRLAAFVTDGHTTPVLRRVCRRIGLEFDKRPRGEVPNPAAHREDVVFIEVPPGNERRFDWCRRIKSFRPESKVVLLLVLPSRHQVLQAARAGADVVLGHPLDRDHVTQKLNALLDHAPSEPNVPAS